jgi:CRP/FNR family transcriptional regulator, cyclic AMP receptor protein
MRKVLYIFGLLNDADVQWMAQTGIRRRLNDGDVIIREGESADSLIFLLEGELLVTTRRLGNIARMGVGEVVGEMSLVDSEPPSATITASGNGLALFLDKTRLMQKLGSDEGFGSRFYQALAVFLADRLRDARRSSGNPAVADENAILDDELDAGILDRLSDAGEKFSRFSILLDSNRVANR